MKKNFDTIDEYIATFPKSVQNVLQQIRQAIKDSVPEVEETISYDIPTFKLRGKGLVSFGGWKNHVGFYPGEASIETFRKELSPFKKAKGSIQFPYDKPIPLDLIKEIVKYRVQENLKEKNKPKYS